MLYASYNKHILQFGKPAGTSRGILTEKETFFIRVTDESLPGTIGMGECALFRGLSMDDVPEYENVLADVCWHINDYKDNYREKLRNYPSILCGLEMAFADLLNGGIRRPFPSSFTSGEEYIRINGLIWMDKKEEMRNQVIEKIEAGFTCIKMKVGAIDFEEELELLRFIRREFSQQDIELRVDANGAFTVDEAREKLGKLEPLHIHSVEQPIKAGNWEAMSVLCMDSPVPVALDEELIGIVCPENKKRLIEEIKPQYIVLKPSLHGGFSGSQEWIQITEEQQTGWWITSALESNIGLNALAQWTYLLNNPLPQGLGTGRLFTNNVFPLLRQEGEKLFFNTEWDKENIYGD
jgi:o-succinylbenzoate synthase